MEGVDHSLNATLRMRRAVCGHDGNGCNLDIGRCGINGNATSMANVVQSAAQFTQDACVPPTSTQKDRLAWQNNSVCDDAFSDSPKLTYTATHGKIYDNYHNSNAYVMNSSTAAPHQVSCKPHDVAPPAAPHITAMQGLGSQKIFDNTGNTAYTVSALPVDRSGTYTYNTARANYVVHAGAGSLA